VSYILTRKLAGELVCAAASASVRLAGRDSRDLFGPSIARGPTNQPCVALTFDDGPSEGTDAILEILDGYKIPAAFFVCGRNVRRLPQLTRAIAAAGHEIGNHTDSHVDLWFRSRSVIRGELQRTQAAVEDAAGIRPRLFRPTFGSRWFGLKDVLDEMSLLRVMWDTGGDDWNSNGSHTAEKIFSAAHHGSIICLHDGRGLLPRPNIKSTLDALNVLIPALLNRGLQFRSLAALLRISADPTKA
jgi:peptidoglycan-N-acetylglucosamine deacetylase